MPAAVSSHTGGESDTMKTAITAIGKGQIARCFAPSRLARAASKGCASAGRSKNFQLIAITIAITAPKKNQP